MPLKGDNQYIAIPEKPIKINVICEKNHRVEKLKSPSLLRSKETCDLIYDDGHMKIGVTKRNVTYESKIKQIRISNETDLNALLTKLEKTPKIFSNINGYQDTLNQITDKANQLQFSHRIQNAKEWGLSILQVLSYASLGLIGIYTLYKVGVFEGLSKCLPSKICIHMLCCKTKKKIR